MTFKVNDGEGNLKDFQSTGTGTGGDPFIPQHLETNSASIAAKQDTIIGHVDGIEALLTALAGYIDGVEAYIDGLEGQLTTIAGHVDGIEGQLTTITGHVDALETLLGAAATEATLSSLNGKVTACNTGAVILAAGSVVKSGSITRPADTNAYVAGDALTDSTSSPTTPSISGCARGNGLGGTIVGAVLVDSANQATKADIDVLIFDTTFTTDNDNAAFTPSDAEMETCIGAISFSGGTAKSGDATSGAGGNCIMQGALNSPIPFVCGAGSTSLFYQPVFRSGYTPVSGEKFTLRLLIQQD